MIKIRNYQKTDYAQVKEILQEADLFDKTWDSQENLSGMTKHDPELILVAEKDHKIVGNIFLIPYGSQVHYIFRLAVKNEFRKQGIATQLINSAHKITKKRNVSEVGLLVEVDKKELHSFYQKRGFQKSNKQYYYMWKELK